MKDLDDKRILSSGYRVAMRRAQKRYKRMRNLFLFLLVAGVVGLAVSAAATGFEGVGSFISKAAKPVGKAVSAAARGVGGLFRGSEEKPASEKPSAKETKKASDEKATLVVVGLDEKTGQTKARGVLVVRFDTKEEKVDGIVIPGNTFLTVPGQGREELTVAYEAGRGVLLEAVKGVIPVDFQGVVEVKYSVYEKMAFSKEFKGAFEKATVINADPAKVKEYGNFAAKLGKEQINLIPLSVKSFAVGDDLYFEPDQTEVARLLKLVWGINQKIVQRPRVIILNGNGLPGVGAKAGKLLVDAGFNVVETKNADNFDYALTKVLVYGGGPDGEKIKKAIGVGVIENQRMETNVADYAVILGADYQPAD
ncbi:MAG: LytR C-terminal domain-containing protein [Candidatus Aquicultorales bacterium]